MPTPVILYTMGRHGATGVSIASGVATGPTIAAAPDQGLIVVAAITANLGPSISGVSDSNGLVYTQATQNDGVALFYGITSGGLSIGSTFTATVSNGTNYTLGAYYIPNTFGDLDLFGYNTVTSASNDVTLGPFISNQEIIIGNFVPDSNLTSNQQPVGVTYIDGNNFTGQGVYYFNWDSIGGSGAGTTQAINWNNIVPSSVQTTQVWISFPLIYVDPPTPSGGTSQRIIKLQSPGWKW